MSKPQVDEAKERAVAMRSSLREMQEGLAKTQAELGEANSLVKSLLQDEKKSKSSIAKLERACAKVKAEVWGLIEGESNKRKRKVEQAEDAKKQREYQEFQACLETGRDLTFDEDNGGGGVDAQVDTDSSSDVSQDSCLSDNDSGADSGAEDKKSKKRRASKKNALNAEKQSLEEGEIADSATPDVAQPLADFTFVHRNDMIGPDVKHALEQVNEELVAADGDYSCVWGPLVLAIPMGPGVLQTHHSRFLRGMEAGGFPVTELVTKYREWFAQYPEMQWVLDPDTFKARFLEEHNAHGGPATTWKQSTSVGTEWWDGNQLEGLWRGVPDATALWRSANCHLYEPIKCPDDSREGNRWPISVTLQGILSQGYGMGGLFDQLNTHTYVHVNQARAQSINVPAAPAPAPAPVQAPAQEQEQEDGVEDEEELAQAPAQEQEDGVEDDEELAKGMEQGVTPLEIEYATVARLTCPICNVFMPVNTLWVKYVYNKDQSVGFAHPECVPIATHEMHQLKGFDALNTNDHQRMGVLAKRADAALDTIRLQERPSDLVEV